MNILLVMENDKALANLRELVEKCYPDSNVVPVSSPSKALELIHSSGGRLDICFTSVLMKDTTGLRLVEELHRVNRRARAVLIANDDSYALDGWGVGMSDYLIEPLTLDSVRHTLLSCR